jgi:transposase-like protein
VQRAQALLQCDQGPSGPAWRDQQVAQAYGCTTRSLESWRKQAVERGPLSLLEHGSWLNVAESELSVLTCQCLDRRIAERATVAEEAGAWAQDRHHHQIGVECS